MSPSASSFGPFPKKWQGRQKQVSAANASAVRVRRQNPLPLSMVMVCTLSLCPFNCPNGCPGSAFGFEVLQFADDGMAGNAFDQGR